MKTNDLRKLIQAKLLTVCANTSFENARDENMFPHVVWNLQKVDLNDLSRDDYFLDVDIWDKGYSAENIENMADSIEALFNCENLPQNTILPTFFRSGRNNVADPDKEIKHRLVTFTIQNYER